MSLLRTKNGFLMKDLTFVVCVRIDCQERLDNLDFCVKFLQKNFPSKILLMEEDSTSKIADRYKNVKHVFTKSLFPIFQRTRLVNKAVNEYLDTGYFCLYDMDVFVDPEIYVEAVRYLSEYSLVYPFNGLFYEIPQKYNKIDDLRMSDILEYDKVMINSESIGGAQFFKVTDFIKGGMENEFFLGWGYEDSERYVRFNKLGYRIKRLNNPMYHFTHPRGINSSGRNPHVHANKAEYEKVCRMSSQELKNYVDVFFHWCRMRKIMKISVVIPVYEMGGKGSEFVKYNIGRILNQTFTDFEIVISDHSVNDDIEQTIAMYRDDRIKYVRNSGNRGSSSANMNCGIVHSSGEIIKPMFQDDFFFDKTALDCIHNVFLSGYKWTAIGSNQTEDRINYSHPMTPSYNDKIIYGKNTISSPSCIAFLRDNEITFDERLIWLMDCKFYYQMQKKHGNPYIIKDILVTNFIHPDQVSKKLTQELKDQEVALMKTEYPE